MNAVQPKKKHATRRSSPTRTDLLRDLESRLRAHAGVTGMHGVALGPFYQSGPVFGLKTTFFDQSWPGIDLPADRLAETGIQGWWESSTEIRSEGEPGLERPEPASSEADEAPPADGETEPAAEAGVVP